MAIALRYAARSDTGLVRANNQDSGYAGPQLLVVADGMGGHVGGDIASSLAVGRLAALDGEALGSTDAQTQLADALQDTNQRLRDRVSAEPTLAGMGTTVTALLRTGNRLILAHIGDSRAYLLRDDELVQVTTDHTYVQTLVDEGRITAEEAEHHPQRNVIMRVLTGEHGDEPDLSVREGRVGDRWLLCSDGLSGFVSHETVHETLAAGDDPSTTAQNLVKLALRAGGPDNVTVIVADVVDIGDVPSITPQIVGSAASRSQPGTPRRGNRDDEPAEEDDSPASRAAALGRGELTGLDEESEPPDPGNRSWFFWVVVVLVVLGLAGAAWAGWSWSQAQYYVGASPGTDDRSMVTIFRGLPQDIGPLGLSSVDEITDVAVEDLPPFSRNRVEDHIMVSSRSQADDVVEDLREQSDGGADSS